MAIIQPSQLATGSYSLSGSFSGSFQGNGAGLNNISASAIVGLSSTQIASGAVTASVSTGTGSFTVTSGSSTFMFISSSGNVGIGTSLPTSPLTVIGSSQFGNAAGAGSVEVFDGFYSYAFGKSTSIYNPNNNYTRIWMSSSETKTDNLSGNFIWRSAARTIFGLSDGAVNFYDQSNNVVSKFISTTGNFLIGTTTDAGYKLDVNGTARVSGNTTILTNAGRLILQQSITGSAFNGINFNDYSGVANSSILNNQNTGEFRIYTGVSYFPTFYSNASERMRLATTGNVLINTITDTGHKLLVSGSGVSGSVNLDNTLYVSGSNVGVGTSMPFSGSSVLGIDIGVFNTIGSEANLFVRGFSSLGGTSRGAYGAVGSNYYLEKTTGNIKRAFADVVSLIDFASGGFRFNTSGGGAIGSLITLTELMRINTNGNVLINTTTDAGYKLDVNGTARITGNLNFVGSSQMIFNGAFYNNVNDRNHFGGAVSISTFLRVGTNANTDASSILQADSTTKGFLPPRMTTTQKNAIATPAEGLMVYDTVLKRPCFYDGTSWVTL